MRVRLLGSALLLVGMLSLAGCSRGEDGGRSDALVVGSRAPAFSLETSEGGTVSLEDFAGRRPVLLYFSMGPG